MRSLMPIMTMSTERGDRIIFTNVEDRWRAGLVMDILEEAGRTVLLVSADGEVQLVPLTRLQAKVTLMEDESGREQSWYDGF